MRALVFHTRKQLSAALTDSGRRFSANGSTLHLRASFRNVVVLPCRTNGPRLRIDTPVLLLRQQHNRNRLFFFKEKKPVSVLNIGDVTGLLDDL